MEKYEPLIDAVQTASDELYKYDRLPQGDFFRYLALQPGSGEERIECTLHTTHLADTEYEAISYVWGTEIRDHDILCNGHKLSITKNLHDALQRLRYPAAVRRLWADSICIHQQNAEEKAHQVANMGRIYAEARRVLLCMGPDPFKQAPELGSLLRYMRRYFHYELAKFESLTWNLIPFPSWNDPILTDVRWHSLEAFLHLPWFKRGWVVREAGLARDCLVIWGTSEFDWTDLMWVAMWLVGRGVTIAALPSSYQPLNAHIDAYWDRNHEFVRVFAYESPLTPNRLLDYISLGRYLHFKDRRDSIYAFFDLAVDSDNELRLIADYDRSPHEVFRKFAIQYLHKTNDVTLLEYIANDTQSLQTILPTWIPTWEAVETKAGMDDLRERVAQPALLSQTGLNHRPEIINDEILKVHGVIYDSVEFITEPLNASIATPRFVFHLWLRLRASFHHVGSSEGLQYVVMALTNDTPRGQRAEWGACVSAYADELYQFPVQTEVVHWAGDGEHHRRLNHVHDWIQQRTENKRFLITKRGYIGLAPAAAQQGDLCGIVFGCTSSCLLRISGLSFNYQFIGSASIQGYRIKRVNSLENRGAEARHTIEGEIKDNDTGSNGSNASALSQSINAKSIWHWGLFGTEKFKHWTEWDVEEQDIYLC